MKIKSLLLFIIVSLTYQVTSQSNRYTCPECDYENLYHSSFSNHPYKLDESSPFFKNTLTTKKSINDLTSIANHKLDYDAVEYLNHKAKAFYNDSVFMGVYLAQLSLYYWNKGYIDSSLYYDYKSIDILSRHNPKLCHKPYFSISQSYKQIDSTSLSLKYGIKAFESIQDNLFNRNDSTLFTSICYNLHTIYDQHTDHTNLSEKYLNIALDMVSKTNDPDNRVVLNNALILKLMHQNNIDSAYNLCMENIGIIKEASLISYLSYSYTNMGKLLYDKDDYSLSLKYLDSAIAVKNGDWSSRLTAHKIKILVSPKTELKTNLIELLKFKDSLSDLENNKNIALLTTKFETKEIQKQNEILQKDIIIQQEQVKTRNYIIIFIISLMCILIYWVIERRKRRQLEIENKALNLEHKLLRTQMSPHFIFNSLAAIQNVVTKGDSYKAEKELGNFSVLLRNTLDASRSDFIEIEDEIEGIKSYLRFQKALDKDSFDYDLNIEDKVIEEDILIPPMLIQPFIENAIKYGKKVDNINKIEINFKINHNALHIEIFNHGNWLDKSNNHTSHSINITKERIDILNQKRKDYIRLFIEKSPSVKILFKIQLIK